MARARIGTSGYQYDHWRDVFYPAGLAKSHWFGHYAEYFDTVEINNTFYHLPALSTFDSWREEAPEGFCYALKYSRYGSHLKRLKEPQASLDKFLEGAQRLEARLGPILVQLPPHWGANPERLDAFLEAAPNRHRWAVEFRDPDWLCEEVYTVLRRHSAALCIHDMISDHPRLLTTDWVYLRYHGDHYRGSYTPQFLTAQAGLIREWIDGGHDVYAYFNNDEAGHAVANALDLKRYLEN